MLPSCALGLCLFVGTTIPLSGQVVDDTGKPVAGATVYLGDTNAKHKGPELLASVETDREGRFRLERPDDLPARGPYWSPCLWAYAPGHRLGSVEFKHHVPTADEPVRLTVGPPASTSLRVVADDGQPVVGAHVQPVNLTLRGPRPPQDVFDRLAAATDAQGRATIDGLNAGPTFTRSDVKVSGQIVQTLPTDPDTGVVHLRPLGRLRVRVVADNPAALAGWTLKANIRHDEPGYVGPFGIQWASEETSTDGRVELPPLAVGPWSTGKSSRPRARPTSRFGHLPQWFARARPRTWRSP